MWKSLNILGFITPPKYTSEINLCSLSVHHNRYLLQFGEVSDYLGYSAMMDYFPRMTVKPNPECDECRLRQESCAYEKSEEVVQEKEVKNRPHSMSPALI